MSGTDGVQLSRRGFMKVAGGAAALAVVPGALVGCGSSSSGGTKAGGSKGGSFGEWTYQMGNSWESEFVGEAIGVKNGYFTAAGFSGLKMVPGSGATSGETYVATRQGQVSISSAPLETAAAIKAGLPVKIVAVHFQTSPQAVISPADKPIKTPQDLIGKKVGVPPATQSIWNGFLKANGIDATKIKVVPVTFDPSPITTGAVDAILGFSTNQPLVLASKGFKTYVFKFTDFKFASSADLVIVSNDTIAKNRDAVKAYLKADIQGWQAAESDLPTAVHYMVDQFGKVAGLTYEAQIQRAQAEHDLMVTPVTKTRGLFTYSAAQQANDLQSISDSGITISAADLYDLSMLSEVYQENPSLVTFSG
jgi:ABC-type nitrate/sulfonate/bicarbonate transport system substrate-binding protein